ncbi:MAG: hypothetical protein V4615_04925 [Bacteroidota bacterium]
MSTETQQIEEKKEVTGKTVVSFTKPTPTWATWVFRIIFILTGIATFILAADPAIAAETKVRIAIYLKGVDMFIWAITRAIGVDMDRDYGAPEAVFKGLPGRNDQQLG